MKQYILTILTGAVLLCASFTATAQKAYSISGTGDTIKTTTAKAMSFQVQSPGSFSVQFAFERISDTVNAVAYLEGSIDGVDFAHYPGTDSVVLSTLNAPKTTKIWSVEMPDEKVNRMNYFRVYIVPSKANGQAKVRGKIWK